ncbi:MAG: hypothetical protein LBE12_16160, partial [Planctomycetaceae bacterium]|nr:hypothetical protein [Planctomycetaceae bacterium]
GQQYLRARYYDPVTGRFNRLDPFFGNLSDPQSLHKYLYTHVEPVNNVDPSGEFAALVGIAISSIIHVSLSQTKSTKDLSIFTKIVIDIGAFFLGQILTSELYSLRWEASPLWDKSISPKHPSKKINVKISDWERNITKFLKDHISSRTDLSEEIKIQAYIEANILAKNYVKAVQSRAISYANLSNYNEEYFGTGGQSGWFGNLYNTERKCPSWVIGIANDLSNLKVWKVKTHFNVIKGSDWTTFPIMHSFISLKIPTNENNDDAFVLDPWVAARPLIFDAKEFYQLWNPDYSISGDNPILWLLPTQ